MGPKQGEACSPAFPCQIRVLLHLASYPHSTEYICTISRWRRSIVGELRWCLPWPCPLQQPRILGRTRITCGTRDCKLDCPFDRAWVAFIDEQKRTGAPFSTTLQVLSNSTSYTLDSSCVDGVLRTPLVRSRPDFSVLTFRRRGRRKAASIPEWMDPVPDS